MTRTALGVSELALPGAQARIETGHAVLHEEKTVHWYEEGIPPFVAQEMERLYENFYSSCARLSGLKGMEGVCAFVARRNGKATSAFLFLKEGKRVHVLNEFIGIGGDELRLFAQSAFERYPMASVVFFRAIQSDANRFPFPFQRYSCIEDIVLTLPSSVQEYEGRLSKKLRSNIKTYLNRAKRDYPSFEFQMLEREAADEKYIRDIIRFNAERMRGKDKLSGIMEDEANGIVEAVKACGLIAVVKIDGAVCAGRILFRIGSNYFSRLNAHSPAFNEYRLGTLCNYLSICECIRRGGRELHFLWGREEFKYRFGGGQRDFDKLVIYRSPLHMVLNGRLALKIVIEARIRQLRLWLTSPERKNHPLILFVKKMLRRVRHQAQPF